MKLSTSNALLINVCWLSFACALEHSYRLNFGLSYYFNPQSKKHDGSPCDPGQGNKACDVVLRLAAAPCGTCVPQEIWYPSANESYNDSSVLYESNFGSRHLTLPLLSVTSAKPQEVVLSLTIWDKDNSNLELIVDTSVSYYLGSRTQPTSKIRVMWPLADLSNYICLTYFDFKIDCGLNNCGKTCVRRSDQVDCLGDSVVCTDRVHKECDLLRGNFEYRVKLTQPKTTNTSATIGNSCPEAAYVCFDDTCDESEPLGVRQNSSTVTQNVAPYYIAQVNLTKQSVRVHVLVVRGCKNVSRVKHLVGQLAVPSNATFTLEDSSFAGVVQLQLGCRAGFTGPTCAQLCADCFVDDNLLCADSDRLSADCAHTRLCRGQQPCWHGGTCAVERVGNDTGKFAELEDFAVRCECKQGYSGQFCETAHGESCIYETCAPFQRCFETYRDQELVVDCKCLPIYNSSLCTKCGDLYNRGNHFEDMIKVCRPPASHKAYELSSRFPVTSLPYLNCSSGSFVCRMQTSLCLDNTCRAYKLRKGQSVMTLKDTVIVSNKFAMHLDMRLLVLPLGTNGTKSAEYLMKHSYYWKTKFVSFVQTPNGSKYSRIYSASLINGEQVYVKLSNIE